MTAVDETAAGDAAPLQDGLAAASANRYPKHMLRTQRGEVDWGAVAALAATVAALAGIVIALSAVSQMRSVERENHFVAGLDALWRLDGDWHTPEMGDIRSQAAGALLASQSSDDIATVLDFFDEVAFLLDRGVLDEDMVWYRFYQPMTDYWFASKDFVRQMRKQDASMWAHLDKIIDRMLAQQARRRNRATDDVKPSKAQIREFLNGELGQGQCVEGEDADARRVPL
jgi:hypothetical protein